MNRKLRHTLCALTASGAALAIALMAAVPAAPSTMQGLASQEPPYPASAGQRADRIDPLVDAAALSAEIATASALALAAGRDMDVSTKPHAPRKGSRHRRQTLVMPYFSFSPRG